MQQIDVGRSAMAQVDHIGVGSWLMPVSVWACPDGFDFDGGDQAADGMLCCRLEGSPVRGHEMAASRGRSTSPVAVTYQPAGQRYGFSADGPVRFIHLDLTARLLAMLEEAHGDGGDEQVRVRDDVIFTPDQTLFELLRQYARASLEHQSATRLEMDARVVLIGSHLIRTYAVDASRLEPGLARGGLAPWQLRRVTDFIEADLAGDASLGELSELIGLSTYHFCRAFKRATGLPPHRWRMRRRAEKAADLLVGTEDSIVDVAAVVGYEDPSRFAAAFRQVLGVSPSAFRRDRLS